MPSSKKIKFFKQIAIFLSIVWTVMTYSFFTYQLNNEKTHIFHNTIAKAHTTTKQAEELIVWAFSQKIKAKAKNHNLDMKTDFSLRDLIYSMAEKQGSIVKIEGNYLEDDMTNLNEDIKKVITNVQNNKKDFYTKYTQKGQEYLFYMKPLLADESCLKCHIHDDQNVGDVLGNVNISIKIHSLKEYNSTNFYFLVFTYLSTWIVGLTLIWWIRYKSRKYFDEKTKNYEESIYSLVDMMERRDSYTAGHSKRVANYSSSIAKKLNLNEDEQSLIYRAGMLHDIGKIEIPDALLLKPEKLTTNEHNLIKSHSKVGSELLSREPFYDLASIVLHHHEHYDGSGYPYGLKGDEIPFLSQIISIADVYDAVTTNRAYRKAMSKEEAIKIIEDGRGSLFNPDIVDIALEVFIEEDIQEDISQMPKNMIEEIRFSYYFRDQLTGFFNINYLKFLLTHKENYTQICAYHLNFRNFTAYNKKYGWKQGDKFLQNVSDIITSTYEDCILIRVFGDNFLILHLDKHVDIDKSIFEPLISCDDIKIDFKHINLVEEGIDTFDKLEDMVLKN
jgi:putative nucleotidyltransferase with HDIG domain